MKKIDVEREIDEAISNLHIALDSFEKKDYDSCLLELDFAAASINQCIATVEKLEDDQRGPRPAA